MSEQASTVAKRTVMELCVTLIPAMTKDEVFEIANLFAKVVNRLEKENKNEGSKL